MERIESLINRLKEQCGAGASASDMLFTTQMIVQELQEKKTAETVQGKKVSVSVIMPVAHATAPVSEKVSTAPEPQPVPKPAEPVAEEKPVQIASTVIPRIEDIPTFAYQEKEIFELNDSVSASASTLNDRLKTVTKELGNVLKESPIKDLKKAIGINDRFVFIDELFRGDENMYERSIKTINGFSIFAEAEYWIQRELKVKLGWDEDSSTVQHFDQLVRRRFL